ncbi:MAG: ABC transporter substrate-binding protein [Gemmatimonadetes bacterium]|nr:ABC transporter substrate-binding protein [Gemmatimonadota bacterium]
MTSRVPISLVNCFRVAAGARGASVAWRASRYLLGVLALAVTSPARGQSSPRAGGELAYGESPGLGSLNPHASISTNGPTDRVLSMVYEPLFRFDFNSEEWESVLATNVTSVAPRRGKSAFTVELKTGVFWHDGNPFTATDVIRTYEYLRLLTPNKRRREQYGQLIADVRRGATATQVVFEFTRPVQDPREYLLDFVIPAWAVPAVGVPPVDSLDLNRRPIGTGPYKFEANVSGYPVMVVNDRYHGNRGALARVRARMFSDSPTMVETLLTTNGDIGLAVEVPPEALPRIEANKGYSMAQVESYNVFAVAIRAKAGSPLASERARRALTMAVNREQILANWFVGKGQVLASPVGPRAPYYDPEIKPISFDSALARRELAAVGLGPGRPLTFIYPAGEMAMDTRTANVVRSIKDALEAVGVAVTERPLARLAYERALFESGDYDLAYVRWEFNPAYDVTPLFHSEERRPGGYNYMNFSDPLVDRLLNDYRLEIDPNRRMNVMKELQRQLRDKAPAIYLVNSEMTYAYTNRLRIPPGRVDPFYFFTYVNLWRLAR